MKVNVYRVTYYTVTEAAEDSEKGAATHGGSITLKVPKGSELSRTPPVTFVFAAEHLDDVMAALPKTGAPNIKNVMAQSHILQHGIEYAPPIAKRDPAPKVAPVSDGVVGRAQVAKS